MNRNRLFTFALAAVVLTMAGIAVYQRSSEGLSGLLWGWRDALPVEQKIDKSNLGVNFGVYDPAGEFADSNKLAIEHIFVSWLDDNQQLIESSSNYSHERHRWMMITIEPWAREDGISTGETLFSDIRTGNYDGEIERVCTDLASQGQPVLIRWGHEMDMVNGRYPWAQQNADGYAESFRYFVTKCRTITPQAWFVWSPVSEGPQMHRYWPGGEYVDWIGLSIFGFPEFDLDQFGKLRSFADIFGEKYERIKIYEKQIMVAELGVMGEPVYQDQWMMALYRSLGQYPLLKTLVYFNNQDVEGVWGDHYSNPDWSIARQILD